MSTADLFDTVRNIPFGFKIGEIRVSFQAILAAILVMVLLLVLMRIIQRWLERELLPRTGLEPSLAALHRDHLRVRRRYHRDSACA